MKFGLFGINNGILAQPDASARVARAAEDAGFDSVWTAEHVVLPDPRVPPSPAAPETPMLDPAASLSFIAAQTSTIKLATGIIILPQRNPLVLAKEIASVDVLSKGRMILGVGAGYLEPEFRAIGVPLEDRGERVVEYLEAMRALWEMDKPEYSGRFVSFSGINAMPRPVQKPLPYVMGGHSGPAYRRSVSHCQGWYGFARDVEGTKACLEGLRRAASQVDRPKHLGELEITITPPPVPITKQLVEAYESLGVHRLALLQLSPTPEAACTAIETVATEFLS